MICNFYSKIHITILVNIIRSLPPPHVHVSPTLVWGFASENLRSSSQLEGVRGLLTTG